MRPLLSSLALVALVASSAHAEEIENDPSLYFGTGNHVKLGVDMGISSFPNASILSFTPTLEGRFAISDQYGIQVILPTMFVSVSPDGGESSSRFELANPTIAFEAVLEKIGFGATIVRAGVALPLVSFPDSIDLSDPNAFEDIILQAANISMSAGSRGMFNMWRYVPDTLSVFGELVAAVDYDGLFMEFGAGLGVLIPTSDNADTEIAIQASAKMGVGTTVIPYIGLGFVIVPTEYESSNPDDGGEDAFQFGIQAGLIAKLGTARLDFGAQLNVDSPFGFSFDDGGVFGLNLAATVPF
jgi:hypothetical protein